MSLRNNIAIDDASLGTTSYEKAPGDFLSAPKNLSGSVVNKGEDVVLQWDPPDSEVTVFSYEVFVDGSKYSQVQTTSEIFEGMVNGTVYNFKVRAVGPLGLRSAFSTQISFTGGGLPELNPYLFNGEFEAASIMWQDIQDNQYYTIEGYNVYANIGGALGAGDKLNSSLLGLDVLRYSFFTTGLGTSFNIGVSFEYDGGTESQVFQVSGTTRSDTTKETYVMTNKFFQDKLIVTSLGLGSKIGVQVRDGVTVRLEANFNPFATRLFQKWSSVDSFDFRWAIEGLDNSKAAIRAWKEGCANADGLGKVKKLASLSGATVISGRDIVYFKGDRGSYNKAEDSFDVLGFIVTGPYCPGTSPNLSISVIFHLDSADVLDSKIGVSGNFEVVKKLSGRSDRLTNRDVVAGSGKVHLTWYLYGGVFGYEAYIRVKGTTPWGTPIFTAEAGEATGQHIETGLLNDTYEAKIRYLKEDGTYYSTESNIIEFTIS